MRVHESDRFPDTRIGQCRVKARGLSHQSERIAHQQCGENEWMFQVGISGLRIITRQPGGNATEIAERATSGGLSGSPGGAGAGRTCKREGNDSRRSFGRFPSKAEAAGFGRYNAPLRRPIANRLPIAFLRSFFGFGSSSLPFTLEALAQDHRLVARSSHGPRQQLRDVPLGILIGRNADGTLHPTVPALRRCPGQEYLRMI